MASSMQQMAATVIGRSKTLINNDLKKICKEEGLPVTGNKAALQERIQTFVNSAADRADSQTLQRIMYRVQHRGDAPPDATNSGSHEPPHMATNGHIAQFDAPNYPTYQPRPIARPRYLFKDSPFYEIRDLLLGDLTLEASPSHRQNKSSDLILSESVCTRLKTDPTLRLLLFGAAEQPLAPYTRLDISFPSQIEVRINNEEIKANYKGLKNKPGSTRPADITNYVRKNPVNYRNNIVVTYALTQKRFTLFVYLAKKFSVEELAQRIKQRNVITRQSVLDEMLKKANDPDIEVGSSVMSLKDPISTLRINTPCRSTLCTHNQCFDAESFLQLQEQAPTWTCPICSRTISFEGLAVDQYVEEILTKVRNADQVTIKPNGEWSLNKDNSPPRRNGYSAQDDSDDDLVELSDFHDRLTAIKSEAGPTPVSLSTPPLPSRETSIAPRSNNKRPSEVVDLTLSDDDEPVRPAKKVAYNPTPSILPDAHRRFHLPSLPNTSTPPIRTQRSMPPRSSIHSMYSTPNTGMVYPQPSTPPDRSNYGSYRNPPPFPPQPPSSRPNYPGSGTSQYPAYLGSSP